jgi:uncharacterized protein
LAKNSSGIHRLVLAWACCTTLGGADHPALSSKVVAFMRRTLLLLSTMMLALLLACGVALAAREKTPELPTVTIHASWTEVVCSVVGDGATCPSASRYGEVRVRVEVADDPAEQAKGLMDRTTLGENRGMLFVFPDEEVRAFWMKDTLIPLSIAFIDSQRRIIDIQDMKPLDDEPPHYVSAEPAQYALEVNQGFFEKRGVKVGDRVELPQ